VIFSKHSAYILLPHKMNYALDLHQSYETDSRTAGVQLDQG